MLIDKLESIKNRYEDVELQLSSPEAMKDMKKYTQLSRDYKDLKKIVEKYYEYKDLLSNYENAKSVLADEKDDEFRDLAKIEMDELAAKIEKIEREIPILLIPADPEDSKNAIMEIRA